MRGKQYYPGFPARIPKPNFHTAPVTSSNKSHRGRYPVRGLNENSGQLGGKVQTLFSGICRERNKCVVSKASSGAVGSLVVRASDSRPEGLGSMLDVTKYPSSAHGFTCRNCGGGDRGRVAIYRPFGEVSLSLNHTVTCMVLKANDRRTSCPCHDEFRGPRSDYVRQIRLCCIVMRFENGIEGLMITFSKVIFDFKQLVNVMRSEVPTVCFYWSGGVAMSINDRFGELCDFLF
ncbi:uncharacterized protein TNCV_3259861 [Trichonephila clavipes]|nr:uncharacterized protein TNCV_3259861 [Trichonephila clavipes]